MTKLLNFLNQRSQREQKLLLVAVVLILCLLAMSFVSNLIAKNSPQRAQNTRTRRVITHTFKLGQCSLCLRLKLPKLKTTKQL